MSSMCFHLFGARKASPSFLVLSLLMRYFIPASRVVNTNKLNNANLPILCILILWDRTRVVLWGILVSEGLKSNYRSTQLNKSSHLQHSLSSPFCIGGRWGVKWWRWQEQSHRLLLIICVPFTVCFKVKLKVYKIVSLSLHYFSTVSSPSEARRKK